MLVLLTGLFMLIANLVLYHGAVAASRLLHESVLEHLLLCPTSFYDTTPSGRILNRFGKDMNSVDDVIPMRFSHWIRCFMHTATTLLVICFSTWMAIIGLVPLFVLYVLIQVLPQNLCR